MSRVAQHHSPQDDRHAQARAVCELMLELKAGAPRSGAVADEEREAKLIEKLMHLCLPEVYEAVAQDPVGRVFCDLWISLDAELKLIEIRDNFRTLWEGVRHALYTYDVEHRDEPASVHVKTCVSKTLAYRRDERITRMRELSAKEVLPDLLETPRPNAIVLLAHLTSQQRSELREVLYRRLGNEPFALRLDHEPEEQDRWLLWYLWRGEFEKPEVKRALGGVPRVVVVAGGGTLRFNKKTGEPIDPLGPMHAKIWMMLGRELNKHGHTIKDPESKSRIAKSLGVSRSTVDRYLEADVPVKLTPDGKGGVEVEGTLEDVLTSIETFRRKPGPRAEGS